MSVYPEEKFKECLARLNQGLHPFPSRRIRKDSQGNPIERICDVEVVDLPRKGLILIHYNVRLKFERDGVERWPAYPYILLFSRPLHTEDIRMRMINSGFPPAIVDDIVKDWIDKDKEAMRILREYVDIYPSYTFLTLIGDVELGKTYACVWAIKELYQKQRVRTIGFLKSSDLDGYARFSKSDIPEVPSRDTDILLIDDLGAEYVTEIRKEILYNLIDYRLSRKLPTLLTSNVPDKESLERIYEPRLVSRLSRDGIVQVLESEKKDKHEALPEFLQT